MVAPPGETVSRREMELERPAAEASGLRSAVQPRPSERRLLFAVMVLGLLGYCALAGLRLQAGVAPADLGWDLAALGSFAAGLWALHLALCRMGIRGDQSVVPIMAMLTLLGLLLRLRLLTDPLSQTGFLRGLVFPGAAITCAVAVWVCRRRLHWLQAVGWLCGVAAVAGMAVLVREGVQYRGAMYGPGLTTPTEALKLLLVVFLANFLRRRPGLIQLGAFAAIWLAVIYYLLRQSDLGMVMILSALLLSLLYVSTGRTRYLMIGLVGAMTVATVAYYLAPAQLGGSRGQRRIDTWLRPWQDPDGRGYQALQAHYAIAAGGLDGRGLGAGRPDLTPIVESDFIYVVIAEEMGLLGSLVVLGLYLALIRRGYRIAGLACEPFRQRLAIGCVTVLAIQVLVNVGGVIRLIPVTGITLPFISHGGSSLLVSSALIGILLAVGHDVELGEPMPRRRGRRRHAPA